MGIQSRNVAAAGEAHDTLRLQLGGHHHGGTHHALAVVAHLRLLGVARAAAAFDALGNEGALFGIQQGSMYEPFCTPP